MSTDLAQRLAVVGRSAEELMTRVADGSMSVEEVLSGWERGPSPAASLELANRWCQLSPPGVTAVRKLLTAPPTWVIEGATGAAHATTAQLAEFRYCKVKIIEATGQVPTPVERGRVAWDKVLRALVAAAEDVEVGPEARDGLGWSWVEAYVDAKGVSPDEASHVDALDGRLPYVSSGHLHVFSSDLLHWLRTARGDRIDDKRLAVILHAAGGECVKRSSGNGADKTTHSVWRWRWPR